MISLYFLDRSASRWGGADAFRQLGFEDLVGMNNQTTRDHIAQLAYVASSREPNISTT